MNWLRCLFKGHWYVLQSIPSEAKCSWCSHYLYLHYEHEKK